MSEPTRPTTDEQRVLRTHRLPHLGELRLHESLFNARFPAACSMMNCSGHCCKYGVYADLAERDKILANAELVIRHMDPHQEKNPARWFEEEEEEDRDFPSGRAIGTNAMDYGCVFLNGAGRCTLQIAAVADGRGPADLKPFYCFAYPIVISDGELMLDDEDFLNRPECCQAVPGGTKTVFELCEDEVRYMLGDAATEELRGMLGPDAGRNAAP